MIDFNNYMYFRNYCLKILFNKKITLTSKVIDIFENFEIVPNFLEALKKQKKIYFTDCVLNAITDLLKSNKIDDAISHMDYFIRKISKFENGEIDIYYVFSSLKTMLGVDIQFTEDFITSLNIDDIFYPSRLKILEISESSEKIYSISNTIPTEIKIPGIYFIYDSDGAIAYIGKSSSCALKRSISSIVERSIINFSKIEIRKTKAKSDIGIYESFYISKFNTLL